jgi:hypothetical protein
MRNAFLITALVLLCVSSIDAQKRRIAATARPAKDPLIGQTAVVMDETISILRSRPSLFAESIQRLRIGRRVRILGSAEADGVTYFRIAATPPATGWIQSDAVFGNFRAGDEARLAALVRASEGFEQIEAAAVYFELYPKGASRGPLMLLFGDLLEDAAAKITRDANNRLDRRYMAASGAPLHSYYLNFVSLDRYRKLGITFLFNTATRSFHYDGAAWRDLLKTSPGTAEAAEAERRLAALKVKMAATARG